MPSVMDFYAKKLDPVIGGKITDFSDGFSMGRIVKLKGILKNV